MFSVFNLAVFGFLLGWLGGQSQPIANIPLISWQNQPIFHLPTAPDPRVAAIVADYLQDLTKKGLNSSQQRVLIETEWADLADHQGNLPASGASLTKIATTLAAVETWPLDHRFATRFYSTGEVKNGVLEGDLIIEGEGDPLFVWEEAIAVGNGLHQLGIRQVKGDLIVTGKFAMNFQTDPLKAGELLKIGLDQSKWSKETQKAFQSLPSGTQAPQVKILGMVRASQIRPENARLLLGHQSLTLTELLRQMNIYSNNVMSEMLAELLGGPAAVDAINTKITGVGAEEIQLINGSGLGVENRLSPRAVIEILKALDRKLANQPIQVADLFPVGGRDTKGTMQWRAIPKGVMIKTGTLAQVSALAGEIPTQERGKVWFVIMNAGSGNIEGFRNQQDRVLQALDQHWQILPEATKGSIPPRAFLGDPSRVSQGF
ncbi:MULTISPECIES: D-alanyl-D-alanine carboxypeptidase [unclassified Microcystis]|uniref:D-alanyl-D-alanine carboxypeptidase n=1 Tax=unclassified Microcystis TaxID=2643300 RepID=UPI0011939377|nr:MULTISPECIES: D-alanyl-D-alanine carboxypeptidase [unclassified Microcystis]MCA2926410.1 D-alanyl-D-alanine carboxypeptidase [Microcystis sp. M020S1]MCA2934677.1 D-alanyl-D-alanine carboxypeptidase [Microcystis sp. M015S1]MCA2621651.1 D-alanyl-D-alanine carboxypeptidase [Microcystis sp. M099S2]MCA2648643.1 D-alanyl-D-alanine carboxypeptidase [Microcystis sp. M065S2]MCA2679739.1 D-alanyl-D-alanine carboxypeptidase [Microcystis sp. M043S2]